MLTRTLFFATALLFGCGQPASPDGGAGGGNPGTGGGGGEKPIDGAQCNGTAPAAGFPALGTNCGSHFVYTTHRNSTLSFDNATPRGVRPVKGGGFDLYVQYDHAIRQPQLIIPSLQPGVYFATQTRCVDPADPESSIWHEDTAGANIYLSADWVGGNGRVEVAGNDGTQVWGRFSGHLCESDQIWCVDLDGTFSARIETPLSDRGEPGPLCGPAAVTVDPAFPPIGGLCGAAVFAFAESGEGGECWRERLHSVSRGARRRADGSWDVAMTRAVEAPYLKLVLPSTAVGTLRPATSAASITRVDDGNTYFARGDHGEATIEIAGNDGTDLWLRFQASLCPCLPAPPGGACVEDTLHCRTWQGRVTARMESIPSDLP